MTDAISQREMWRERDAAINLRDYQRRALDDALSALDRRPVLVMPTGAGKTVTAVELIRSLGSTTRVLWLAHRRELIQQAAAHLIRLGLRCGVIMAGQTPDPTAPVQVASIQTLARRRPPPAELVVLDEAHHASARTYQRVLSRYEAVPIVGLTATPFRLDGRGLGDIFGALVVAAYTDELVADGTLVEPIVYAPAVPDLRGVNVDRGDYNQGVLGRAINKRKLIGDIVETWLARCNGRRTVAFAVTVAHAQAIAAEFRAAGVRAEHLDGTTSKPQRDAILYRLRTGYTDVVTNCSVLTEGWDLPGLEVAVVARPTASLCLHLQMIGRIMRCADGKAGAVVLDHAGNHHRLGMVTQRVPYSLDDRAVTHGAAANAEARSKRCPDCYLVCAPHVTECSECGHRFVGKVPEAVAGELVRFGGAAAAPSPRPRPTLEQQQAAWDALESQRTALGYRAGWSYHRFNDRFGFRPLVHDGVVCDPETCGPEVRRAVHRRMLDTAVERGYKPGWAAHQYRAVFGEWPRGR